MLEHISKERRCTLISDSELLKLLHNKPELGLKTMIDSYMPLIYTVVFNDPLIRYSKEDIEECASDVFFKVFNHKDRINSQKSFIKVFLETIAKRKVIDMYRRNKNNNQIPIDNVSTDLHTASDHIGRLILLKESNSQLTDAIKSLDESNSEIITRKYSLNQNLKDISKNTGLKVSAYA